MGMPAAIEIVDEHVSRKDINDVFSYFDSVDERFSTYKSTSEISAINAGRLALEAASEEMKEVFRLAEETKRQTNGYFDIRTPDGAYDPSGLVKGWAINKAGKILKGRGFKNFCLDVGGDIEACGTNALGKPWRVGVRDPLGREGIVKVVNVEDRGVATSGTYLRGQHIYDPHAPGAQLEDIASLTVVGPDVYEADRFATAAFAMGQDGAAFIAGIDGLECYMVGRDGIATMTDGFKRYTNGYA